MSLTASAFAYSWSRWNSDSGKEKIVIQATEQENDEAAIGGKPFICTNLQFLLCLNKPLIFIVIVRDVKKS